MPSPTIGRSSWAAGGRVGPVRVTTTPSRGASVTSCRLAARAWAIRRIHARSSSSCTTANGCSAGPSAASAPRCCSPTAPSTGSRRWTAICSGSPASATWRRSRTTSTRPRCGCCWTTTTAGSRPRSRDLTLTTGATVKTNGSTRDYRAGRKNNHRRWGWNQVIGMCNGLEKTWPIIYLTGPQDFDRDIAIGKGVPPTNLIGVDYFSRNVNRVRRHGGVAICDDVLRVLGAWPADRPVAAVVLDFCSGLEWPLLVNLVRVLHRIPFRDAVLWANFLRGRDASSNRWRAVLQEELGTSYSASRGRQFFLLMVALYLGRAHQEFGSSLSLVDCAHRMEAGSLRPTFRSYDSVGAAGTLNVFDSVVMRATPSLEGVRFALGIGGEPLGVCTAEPERLSVACDLELGALAPARTKRLMSAALAVRTMRQDR